MGARAETEAANETTAAEISRLPKTRGTVRSGIKPEISCAPAWFLRYVPFVFIEPVPSGKRDAMREVALTYRRIMRAGYAAGRSPPEYHQEAIEAAYAVYQRLDPDAPKDRRELSHKANLMIANAINANSRWFWHGPDA